MPLIPATAYRPVTVGEHTYWCFTRRVRMPTLGMVRIVVSFEREALTGRHVVLVTNRVDWRAAKIIGLYSQRWPTEIVQTQRTKWGGFPLGARGDDVPISTWLSVTMPRSISSSTRGLRWANVRASEVGCTFRQHASSPWATAALCTCCGACASS